jgi:hypothetical protein
MYLCRPSEASTWYCVIPGGDPPQDWQSLPCAGEELDSNPGLQTCSQVRSHWATSPPSSSHLSSFIEPPLLYSLPGCRFGYRGVIWPILRNIQQSFKGPSFLKSTVGYFNFLGTCVLCLQKLPNLKDHNQLSVYSSPGNQLRMRIIHEYSKKFEIVSGHAYWDQDKLGDKKTGED